MTCWKQKVSKIVNDKRKNMSGAYLSKTCFLSLKTLKNAITYCRLS